MTSRKRPLPQTCEMRILQDTDRIPWTHHQRRQNVYGPRQTERNMRMASPKERETSTFLAWIRKLLLKVHLRIFSSGATSQSTAQERSTLYLD